MALLPPMLCLRRCPILISPTMSIVRAIHLIRPGLSRTRMSSRRLSSRSLKILRCCMRVIIRPAGKGFLPSKPTAKAITAVIEDNYHTFWPTWGTLKDKERRHMFKSFGTRVAWEEEEEGRIEKNFHMKASHNLSDMLRDARRPRRTEPMRMVGACTPKVPSIRRSTQLDLL